MTKAGRKQNELINDLAAAQIEASELKMKFSAVHNDWDKAIATCQSVNYVNELYNRMSELRVLLNKADALVAKLFTRLWRTN